MLTLLLLAGISRCASPDLCPTDAELSAALRLEAEKMAAAFALAEHGGHWVSVHPLPIRGLRDVHCGEALYDDPHGMNCSFTVRYPRSTAFAIARLAREGGRWVIADYHEVRRARGKAGRN